MLYNLFLKNPIICTDSRTCPTGSIFFALKGDNFNANAFALSALQKGCSYAIIDEAEYAIDERFILVDNVLESLQQLARYHRQQLGTTIIGITGTNGKTTTKELVAAVLKQKFDLLYTQGNLNNHIGVPLTLLKLKHHHEIAIIEMGANHPGDIKLLAEIACPDYGIITNVGKAHLEGFGSFEGVMKTKAELYDYITSDGKLIFINKANQFLAQMAKDSKLTDSKKRSEYSLEASDHKLLNYGMTSDCSPFLSMKCKDNNNSFYDINTQLVGAYNAENVLAAVTIANYFGVEAEKIKAGLEAYAPQNNRSQLTVTEHNKLIVDAYNANPTSMQAAIQNFAQMEVENKILILGDMLELGEQSDFEHLQIVELLEQNKFTNVYLVGKEFSKINSKFEPLPTVNELIELMKKDNLQDSIILIKGSRGIQLEKIIPFL